MVSDFVYVSRTNGCKRYNCTIEGLYDRSVVASITDCNITADFVHRALQQVIESQPGIDLTKLLILSDQGS